MKKLTLPHIESAYSVGVIGSDVRRISINGFTRARADAVGRPSTVNIQWKLDGIQHSYFWAFYKTELQNGLLPFIMDLRVDGLIKEEYEVKFLSSPQPTSNQSEITLINGQLEVKRKIYDTDYLVSLVELYEQYGDELGVLINILDYTVNQHLSELYNG